MRLLASLLCVALLLAGLSAYAAAPRVISFQGKLTDPVGVPMAGTFEMTFRLWSSETGGTKLLEQVYPGVVVDNEGLYNVELNIPTSITFMSPVWLGVEVASDGEMSPRYALTSSPYSFWAMDADKLDGKDSSEFLGGSGSANYIAMFTGTYMISNSAIYQSGTNIGIGTTSPTAKLDVSGTLVVSDKANIGPGCTNAGANAFAAGSNNTASGSYSSVGGGRYNVASGSYANVSGGYYNNATSSYATVGGGYSNDATYYYSTVGGGYNNTASAYYSTVGGGYYNAASYYYSTVGGGYHNTASYYYATVPGGYYNTASYYYTAVGGGYYNTASYYYAAVPGGYYNSASGYASLAAGYRSNASAYYSLAAGYYSTAGYDNSVALNGQTTTASGETRVGLLSKAAGTFTIDHPLDPDNKILNHYFAESPEMVLIYRGVAHIGGRGRAEVHLPDYFDALNRNPMVQLTGVGTSDVYVAEEVSGNTFVIGGKPGTKVYWTVTGDRKDQSAEIARTIMPVEQVKEKELAGRSLNDEFLVSTRAQLEEMGQADRFQFRTQAGRERYEESRREPVAE
jgi:hypothetical protein